jgi:hypothetical protein
VSATTDDTLDVLRYDLSLTLAMTDELLEGRMTMQLRLSNAGGGATNRIPLHAATLQIDSARINGVLCTVAADSVNEQIFLSDPAGRLFLSGETLSVQIDYRRLPGIKRPGSRWGYSRHAASRNGTPCRNLRCAADAVMMSRDKATGDGDYVP